MKLYALQICSPIMEQKKYKNPQNRLIYLLEIHINILLIIVYYVQFILHNTISLHLEWGSVD